MKKILVGIVCIFSVALVGYGQNSGSMENSDNASSAQQNVTNDASQGLEKTNTRNSMRPDSGASAQISPKEDENVLKESKQGAEYAGNETYEGGKGVGKSISKGVESAGEGVVKGGKIVGKNLAKGAKDVGKGIDNLFSNKHHKMDTLTSETFKQLEKGGTELQTTPDKIQTEVNKKENEHTLKDSQKEERDKTDEQTSEIFKQLDKGGTGLETTPDKIQAEVNQKAHEHNF